MRYEPAYTDKLSFDNQCAIEERLRQGTSDGERSFPASDPIHYP